MMKGYTLVSLLVLAACSKDPVPPPPTPTPTLMPAAPSGKLEHRMANCPTAIPGVTTRVVNTIDGVDVLITATDESVRSKVRAVAQTQAEMGPPSPTEERHTGLHGGPGFVGHCPIIHDDTRVTASTTDDGATLHVQALDPGRVKLLQDETAVRLAANTSASR